MRPRPPRLATPDSHHFTPDIAVDPAEFGNFERVMEDRPQVALLCRIDRPDAWVVHIACTTERVRAGLWGA